MSQKFKYEKAIVFLLTILGLAMTSEHLEVKSLSIGYDDLIAQIEKRLLTQE